MPTSVSGAVAADGNVLVLVAPAASITDPTAPTSTQLKAGTTKDITYDLTAAGLKWDTAEDNIPDERFTAKQVFGLPGRRTVSASLQYVYGGDVATADTLMVENEDYVIAIRWGVDHDQVVAAADIFDLLLVRAGHKSKDAPAANQNLTKTQVLYPRAKAIEDHALTA